MTDLELAIVEYSKANGCTGEFCIPAQRSGHEQEYWRPRPDVLDLVRHMVDKAARDAVGGAQSEVADGGLPREALLADAAIRVAQQSRGSEASKPLTYRMAESLSEMSRGSVVTSWQYFSYPRWQEAPRSSIGCPTRSMLDGLNERGLIEYVLTGEKFGGQNTWSITINDAGRQALVAYESARKAKAARPKVVFKRYTISYCWIQLGEIRKSADTVLARTEKEAVSKVKAVLKSVSPHYEYTDFAVDCVSNR